jgi:uncharacterized BrkB/YihY/UPF0761 family membrane protein
VTTGQSEQRPPGPMARIYTRVQATRVPLERSLVGRMVLRFDTIDGTDRAAVLALNALLSLVPLAVLGVAIAHVYGITSGDYADGLNDLLNLHGRAARFVRESSASVQASYRSATVVGLGGLVWTAFGFTGALWRTYDRAWGGHRHAGPFAWARSFVWLVLFAAEHTIIAIVHGDMPNGLPSDCVAVALEIVLGFALWLVSPSLLLGRKLPLRVVAPGAALMALGSVVFLFGSTIIMPGVVDGYAEPLGAIGVAIALGFWLWAIAYLWVFSAVVTAVLAEEALDRDAREAREDEY